MNFSHKIASIKTPRSLLAIAVGASLSAMSMVSAAQENNNENSVEPDERISVTGSRLMRTTFDAPTPTVVISAVDIKISGATNINDLLSTMPQFGPGFDSTDGNYSFGNSGLNVLDLRDLGATRTLVLVNGKRPAAVSSDSQFLYADIGMIPSELVERIEVMTGGASAVYGSDAIAGVVNFILKKNYQGTSLRAQFGDTEHGGGDSKSFTLTHGFNFDNDRGNISMSFDYLKEGALLQRDRKNSVGSQRPLANPLNTGPDDGIPDFLWGKNITSTRWGAEETLLGVENWDLGANNWYVIEGQQTTLRTPISALNEGWKVTDGSGVAPDRWGSIENPFERYNAFVNTNYQFESFDLAFDVTYSKSKSSDTIDPAYQSSWFSKNTAIELFDVPQSAIDVIPDGEWIQLHYTFFEAGGRGHKNDREYLSANLSFSGEFANEWYWDVNFSSGQSKTELVQYNGLREDRVNYDFQAIGDCVDAGNCPSFDPFSRPSTEFTDYILVNHRTDTDIKTQAFSANVAGEIYELPAGAVQLSTGLEIRHENIDYQPSDLWQSGNLSSMMTAMDASRTIKEIYAEVLVPVLSDVPLVKLLEIEAALRKADYSTESASFTSSKIGVNWTINDSLRFRSTFSQAVRAPQLAEMFAGESIGFTDMTDPCDAVQIDGGPVDGRRKANCAALGINEGWTSNLTGTRGRTQSSGYEELKEEKANTLTVGFVFQPTFIENFRLSLDYYDIKLTDMITSFGAGDMLSNCVDLAQNSINNDFCKQVDRESNGDVSLVRTSSLNADEARRTGLDIEADYAFDNWKFTLVANRQFEKSTTEFDFVEGTPIKDDTTGELGAQKWSANFVTTYALDDFSASWTTKFMQGGKRWLDRADERYDNQEVKDSIRHNVRAGYNITDEANVYVGINNVTDENGTDHWLTSWGTRKAWDILGRNYYVGFTYNF